MKKEPDSNEKLALVPTPFEHKEAVDDDCGLPQNPIYANYPKYLWKRTHTGFHPNESQNNNDNPKIKV